MTRWTAMVAAAGAVLLWSWWVPVEAQRAREPVTSDSLSGRDTFDAYCASCHGAGGRGDGSLVASLRTRPADLTVLSAGNGGTYPREQVAAAVRNTERPITAHGTGEMPAWGTIFDMLDGSAERARVRIDNVVAYVETLQTVSRPTPEVGRVLYMAYCASCHGPQGRGNGSLSSQLRQPVPDLTQFTTRNGGTFPSVRLGQIIDGRGIVSHGTREMPVWGDAFRSTRGGYSAETVRARIQAIVEYLGQIQERPAE